MLHNYMLDIGATSNVMPLKIMEKLGLKISRPYKNLFGFDSKIVPTHGLIQGQRVESHSHLDISFLMDIVVVDIPITYGVLLSRKVDFHYWGGHCKWTCHMHLFQILSMR